MNPIERLGGYEKAKEKMDDICHTLDNSELLGGGDAREGLYERLESIDKALLEYRRQHNIFEVGDLSLTIDPWFGSNLLAVVDFRESGTERYAIFSDGGFFRISGLRHATDAEIKAGKRLEVKSEN